MRGWGSPFVLWLVGALLLWAGVAQFEHAGMGALIVLVPGALPVILTGLRMGFTVALLSIIGSETIASLAGLGHRIVHLAESMDLARMFAYIVFVIVIAAVLNSFVSWLEARGRRH